MFRPFFRKTELLALKFRNVIMLLLAARTFHVVCYAPAVAISSRTPRDISCCQLRSRYFLNYSLQTFRLFFICYFYLFWTLDLVSVFEIFEFFLLSQTTPGAAHSSRSGKIRPTHSTRAGSPFLYPISFLFLLDHTSSHLRRFLYSTFSSE